MKRAFPVLLAALALLAPATLFGSYTPYVNDSLQSSSQSASLWSMNGSGTQSSTGLTTTSSISYISKVAVPDGSTNYDAAMTLHLTASGGNYTLYLQASSNAVLGSTSTGSFYAFDIENPTFSNGSCSAVLSFFRVVNGSVTRLLQTSVPCADGAVYHAVKTGNGAIRFYTNGFQYTSYIDSQPITGAGGIGGSSMPAGNSISLAQLGPLDTVAPLPVSANGFAALEFSNQVQLHATGTTDDANGIGLRGYEWFRNGTYQQTTETPDWIDTTVAASTTYTYSVHSLDFHTNVSTNTTLNVTTPAAATLDPRETGVRPNGSYWGGLGEQIDVRSGNLNFRAPLVTLMSRGWSVPLGLAYNLQNWENDGQGNTFAFGQDVGFGFGWVLQAGSITPVYADYFDVSYYEYHDASGGVYRLDQNNNNVWTSKESVYVTYDANKQRLYFNNGSWWVMGCQSGGDEADAGTLYPTLMEDSNGNQISLGYAAGVGISSVNTSARLTTVQDGRPGVNPAGASTFTFSYNSDTIPHLTGITNAIKSGDSFSFSYNPAVALGSPFGGTGSYGQASFLGSVTNTATNLQTSFTYDTANAGELTQVTYPYGGHLRWVYQSAAYGHGTVREVVSRYIQWNSSVGERTYNFYHTFGSPQEAPMAQRSLVDVTANAFKDWNFNKTTGTGFGLLAQYEEGTQSTGKDIRSTLYTWALDAVGNSYVSRTAATIDPGQSYAVTQQVDQTLDSYGNVTQTKLYDYGNLSTPSRTYNRTYATSVNGTDYTAMYIRNRLTSTTVTSGSTTITLQQNTYDQYATAISATPGITMQDSAISTGATTRGNVTKTAVPGMVWDVNYDQTGTAIWMGQDVNPNHYVQMLTSTATNYMRPDSIVTANSLTTTMTWSPFMGAAGQTGWNTESWSRQYDSASRPQTEATPYGAQTTYSYSVTAPQVTATVNGRWTKTTLDGLGRVTQVQRGDANGIKSQSEVVYDACGCNPVGKVYQQSMPHVSGATPVYTVYTYDAVGRRLTTTKPDGQSKTAYAYAGNVVTVTDAAGKWKKFTRDVYGQLVQVEEPSPNSGTEPNHITLYTYDVLGHITQVQMARTIGGTVRTQTRTWTYDPTTQYLTSKTSPEAGTVNYTYNPDATLATMTDAKSQRMVFTYDNYGRVTQIARGTVSGGTFTENTTQRTTYTYNGTNGGFSAATNGRVSQATYAGPHGISYVEMYSYHNAGGVIKKRLQLSGSVLGSNPVNMDAGYAYDNEGRVSSIAYPSAQVNSNGTTTAGPTYTYGFDSMGRLNTMTDQANTNWVSSTTYGPSNELLTMAANGFNETRTYNNNLQLIELVSGTNVHRKYNYSTTQNNGQILSQQDVVSGETTTYQYDSLKRMIQASATGDPSGSWSQAMTYDGFGNLTQKSSSNAPALSVAVDSATNRIQSVASYDANGNMTSYVNDLYSYDLQNRMIQASPSGSSAVVYGYDTNNRRIYKGALSGTTYSAEEIYFYGAEGHKYGTWSINPSNGVLLQASVTKQWFGNRLVSPEDRLGSKGKYFAFGEERTNVSPANPSNDQEKFATYTRDSATGLDYANQRYYSSIIGRFTQPDPFGGSASSAKPQSWNRYSYGGNDSVNRTDRNGLCSVVIGGILDNSSDSADGLDSFATATQAIQAFPYAGANPVSAIAGVAAQGFGADNAATNTVLQAIVAAANHNAGPIDIYTFSGGAAAFQSAYSLLPSSIQSRINNVAYVSPITEGGTLPFFGSNHTYSVSGTLLSDGLFTSNVPPGATVSYTVCAHNQDCQFGIGGRSRAFLESLSTGPCSNPSTFSSDSPTGVSGIFVDNAGPTVSNVSSSIFYDPTINDVYDPATFGDTGLNDLEDYGGGGGTSVDSKISYLGDIG